MPRVAWVFRKAWHRARATARAVRGQGLVEYVLVLILVALLCLAGLSVIGQEAAEPMNEIANAMP